VSLSGLGADSTAFNNQELKFNWKADIKGTGSRIK